MDTVLELNNLCAGYTKEILHSVSLSLHRGEIVCLLGRNGCGKTTLLRAVLGSVRIFSGTVHIGGRDAASLSVRERARLTAYVSQQCPSAEGLRAVDLIEMGTYAAGSLLGNPSPALRSRMEAVSDAFGVRDLWNTDCAALSAGQRQMVHLSRAAVQDTPLILLDEPNSALDFDNTHRFLSHLREWIHRDYRGALLILHDPALALRYADRILIMDAGALCAEIRPSEADASAIERELGRIYPSLRVLREERSGQFFCDYGGLPTERST